MSRILQAMMRQTGQASKFTSPFASRLSTKYLTGQRRLASSDPYQYLASYRRAHRFVYAMAGVNVAVYGAWWYVQSSGDSKRLHQLYNNATLTWQNVQSGRYWTLITCAFSHQDLSHLLFNMLGLTTFGMCIANSGAGMGRLMGLFLGSGVAGSAAWLYERRDGKSNAGLRSLQHRDHITHVALGASGIVSGLAGAAACLAPFERVLLFFIPVPLWIGVGLYAAFDFYYLGSNKSQVGHSAHLGGMAFGILYYVMGLRKFGGIFSSSRWMR